MYLFKYNNKKNKTITNLADIHIAVCVKQHPVLELV